MPVAKKKRTPTRAKKTTAKRKTTKKTAAKKPAAKKPVRKASTLKDPMTKTEMFTDIAENTGLTKKQVASVFEELEMCIERHVKKRGPGVMKLPGLMKIQVTEKPATKARKGINPFTGEEIMIKAKPKRRVVKIRPLKKIKEMAE